MSALREYVHEESFGQLADGSGITEAALKERDEAIKLTQEILERMDKLDRLTSYYCPCIEGESYRTLSLILTDEFKAFKVNFKERLKSIRGKIDMVFWENIMATSRLQSVMHNDAKKKMRQQLIENAPEFDRKHVYNTIDDYMNNRLRTFVEGAINVFESLDTGFKSNDKILFRKKVIFNDAFAGNNWYHHSDGKDQISDLERIFMLLDGKDPSRIPRVEQAQHIIENEKENESEEVELPYFTCKLYKKGSVHLVFTRQDLVDKLNSLIASHYKGALGKRNSIY
jgi:hypothetical protein